jgi:hypothetical protein
MTVKSTKGGEVTLMHYVAEQCAELGANAAALRMELKRLPEAAALDLGEVYKEAARLRTEMTELELEVIRAAEEAQRRAKNAATGVAVVAVEADGDAHAESDGEGVANAPAFAHRHQVEHRQRGQGCAAVCVHAGLCSMDAEFMQ